MIRYHTLPCEGISISAPSDKYQFDEADADLYSEDTEEEDSLEAYPNCWGVPPPSLAEEFPALDLMGAEFFPPQFDTAFGNLNEEEQGPESREEDMGYLPEEGDDCLSRGFDDEFM